jgi:hypothetical protein
MEVKCVVPGERGIRFGKLGAGVLILTRQHRGVLNLKLSP